MSAVSGEDVATEVSGRVLEVNYTVGDEVRQGDVLARLDAAQIDADIAHTEREIRRGREEAARLEQLVAALEKERELLARRAESELMEIQFVQRRNELDLRLLTRRGQVDESERKLQSLKRQREQCALRAHVTGVVTTGQLRVGDLVDRGSKVFAIAQQKGFRVDAPIRASDISWIRPGVKGRVKIDAFDYQTYGTLEATVTHVPPDSSVNERGAFYVVRLGLDRAAFGEDARVKFGMTGQVEIPIGRERLLWLLLRTVRSKFQT